MVKVDWTMGPAYPVGIQDSTVGVAAGHLASAGGFSRQPKEIVRSYPEAFGGAAHGFTNLSFVAFG